MGVDRVIFGSDRPHIEGLPTPLDYVVELEKFKGPDAQFARTLEPVAIPGPGFQR